jgi:NitT/TauT family transport system permease protein
LYIRELSVAVTVRRVLLPLLGVALALGVWWAVAVSDIDDYTPTPGAVFSTMLDGFRSGDLLVDIRFSVLRVLIGVGIGCALAVPVGFALAWFRVVRSMFNPLVSFFRALPPLALIPLVVVYLGIDESARLSLLVYAAFFSAVIVIYESVASIDDVYVRAGRALGTTELELFRRVVVPLVVPQIFVGIRVALGVCWATVVAAELVAAQRGLGARMQESAQFFRIDDVFVGIILIGLCAVVMDGIVQLVMARAVRWQERVAR